MLTKLEVNNFRSIENCEVEFAPITIFFGPTAAGKSTPSMPCSYYGTLSSIRLKLLMGCSIWDFRISAGSTLASLTTSSRKQ